jgi:uncharacterized protein YeaO (DUF488 family)
MPHIKTKRIYDSPEKADGFRILIDGLWPRGWSNDKAPIDVWMKEIAPSAELRKWFGHQPERWAEFKQRYFQELDGIPEVVARVHEQAGERDVVLVYSAKDELHNNAVCLKEYLER